MKSPLLDMISLENIMPGVSATSDFDAKFVKVD